MRVVQPSVRRMLPQEAAWVGAMIEGEGSVYIYRRGRAGWRVGLASTDVETLATLLRLTGAGTVRARNFNCQTAAKKQQWYWYVLRKLDIRNLLIQIYPYLTGKREAAEQAIDWASS